MIKTFEYDDYPRDGSRLLQICDKYKRRYPGFKANIFAIPSLMTARWFREVDKRSQWMRLYLHGFRHKKGECWQANPPTDEQRCLLERRLASGDWHPMFKAPHHGLGPVWIDMLMAMGCGVCIGHTAAMPYPMPAYWRWWSLKDAIMRNWANHHRGNHIEAHPTSNPRRARTRKTEICRTNLRRWTSGWHEDDEWGFVEDMLEPALKKVHLGCGKHVLDGWLNLDPRVHLDPRIHPWVWQECIPLADNKADIVFSSHTFNYMEEEYYAEAFLDIWRVLRPGGVYRMSEDDSASGWIWRRPGSRARGTGTIRSIPSKALAIAALERVGFTIIEVGPDRTTSPHTDVLKGNTRGMRWRRGHKYYLEAVKHCPELNLHRVRRTDPRATIIGRYKMPPESAHGMVSGSSERV